MDGLPGMHAGTKTAREENIAPIQKMVGPMAPRAYRNDRRFGALHLVLVAIFSALCTAMYLLLLVGVPLDALVHPMSS